VLPGRAEAASVWKHINRQNYVTARAELDRVIGDIKAGLVGLR
jgi:hypothetical protein